MKLPPHLAEKPHFRAYYGRVDFIVRAYFVGTMGWFDGNPTSLGMLSPVEEAVRFIKLVGGAEAVMAEVNKSRSDGDYQWALQLIDRLISVEHDLASVRNLKAEILREHAVSQINCPTRHYYIQSTKELDGDG